jgi:hypothetical protein
MDQQLLNETHGGLTPVRDRIVCEEFAVIELKSAVLRSDTARRPGFREHFTNSHQFVKPGNNRVLDSRESLQGRPIVPSLPKVAYSLHYPGSSSIHSVDSSYRENSARTRRITSWVGRPEAVRVLAR